MFRLPDMVQWMSLLANFLTVIVLLIKPIRERLFGIATMREGQKCVLRSEMLSIYYEGKDGGGKIRQHEYENFVLLYAAYKAMKGNSFIDKIWNEVQNMEVVT